MATAKQLEGQLEKLKARIEKQQEDLTELKTKQKDIKVQLAEAKRVEKEKEKEKAQKARPGRKC